MPQQRGLTTFTVDNLEKKGRTRNTSLSFSARVVAGASSERSCGGSGKRLKYGNMHARSIHPRNPARRPQEHLQCQRARPYFAFLAVEVTLSCPNVLLPVRNYGPLPWDPALVGSSVSSHSSDQEPLQELLTIALTSREPHSTWALPDL